jgi:hypothetical protein
VYKRRGWSTGGQLGAGVQEEGMEYRRTARGWCTGGGAGVQDDNWKLVYRRTNGGPEYRITSGKLVNRKTI